MKSKANQPPTNDRDEPRRNPPLGTRPGPGEELENQGSLLPRKNPSLEDVAKIWGPIIGVVVIVISVVWFLSSQYIAINNINNSIDKLNISFQNSFEKLSLRIDRMSDNIVRYFKR